MKCKEIAIKVHDRIERSVFDGWRNPARVDTEQFFVNQNRQIKTYQDIWDRLAGAEYDGIKTLITPRMQKIIDQEIHRLFQNDIDENYNKMKSSTNH